MERYLEGEEISHDEVVGALKDGTNHGSIFPSSAASPRAISALAPARRDRRGPSLARQARILKVGELELAPEEDAELFAYVFKTRADRSPEDQPAARLPGSAPRGQPRAQHACARQGADRAADLLRGQGVVHVSDFGPGDIGAGGEAQETRAGDARSRDEPIEMTPVRNR